MPGTSTAPKLATRPGTRVLPDVRLFSTGTYLFRQDDGTLQREHFGESDLDELVANYHRLYHAEPGQLGLRPKVTIRHRPNEEFGESDPRCHGILAPDLRREGDTLIGSIIDMPAATYDAIRRGEYRDPSPEIKRHFADGDQAVGQVIYRVAILGSEQPRGKRLGELKAFADDCRGTFDPAPLDSILCFSEAAAVTIPTEPTPAPAVPPAPMPEPKPAPAAPPTALDPAALAKLQELLAFADELPAIRQNLTAAKADAEAARKLEGDRLDREKREKVKRFLDSPGLCFADDSGRVRVMPCQRSFFEEALLREDAGAVLTFADGDKQIQGTALDRKMAEIRKFPPQLDFSEKMRQPTPDDQGGTVPSPADRDRILSLTPMGKGILQRERERAALALPAAK